MFMMDEFPAYSWQQLRRLSNAREGAVWVRSGERGRGASTKRGDTRRTQRYEGWGVRGGLLAETMARIRTVGSFAFLEIFLPPLAGVYSVARRNQTPRQSKYLESRH